MRADRRGFLQMLGGALLFALGVPAPARAQPGALDVHRATRNTLRRGIGVVLSRLGPRPAALKSYPEAERIALPPADGAPVHSLTASVLGAAASPAFAADPLDLAELGRLLQLTNGVTGRRGGRLLRAAPSAGALYSGEVYVLAEHVTGLAPGVYLYAVPEHALLRVRSGRFGEEVARSVERPSALANASAFVLLTNVFGRYTWRYAERGYRYALVDCGHIGENLRLGAVASGAREHAVQRFHDDRLNALLQVDGRGEAVCALHAVGRAGDQGAVPAPAARRFVEKRAARGENAGGAVTERYHEATKLVESGEAGEPAADPGPEAHPEISAAALQLPAASPLATRVDAAIRARRSAAGFEREPIALESLACVLETACGHASLRRAPGVELYVAAHRVADLPPGLYRYEAGSHRLATLRSDDLSERMVRVCLRQEMAGSAAAGLIMVARVVREAARGGERSYRDQLVEAGAVGQRVYLAAEASGLAARNLAAFWDDSLNALLGLDGAQQAAIHLTMLGREVQRAS